MRKWLKDFWNDINRTPVERYLAGAKDVVELEQRQKNLTFGRVKLF